MDIDLDQMSVQEKRDLADRLALELASDTTGFSDAEVALWAAINDMLKASKVRGGAPSLSNFAAKFGRKQYKNCADALEALLQKACPAGTKRVVRSELRRLMLKCLADYMEERAIPISARTFLNQFEFLEYAVDLQFPGYLACGMIVRIVRIAA